jgi:RHS repeat-associated protein
VKDLFTGQRWIPELGLYDDRNRFMSPDLGRFLQPDPIGFKGDASNLYRYCGNDWANRTDPLGLDDVRDSYEGFMDGATGGATAFLRDNVFHSGSGPGAYGVDKSSAAYNSARSAGNIGGFVAGMFSGKTEAQLGAKALSPLAAKLGLTANKLNHIFGKAEHKLAGLVKQFGSKEKAGNVLAKATQAAVKAEGTKTGEVFNVTVKLGDQMANVTGKVVDGQAKIGTAFARTENLIKEDPLPNPMFRDTNFTQEHNR